MDIGHMVFSFFDNAGPGGAVVLIVIGAAVLTYIRLTRWILNGGKKGSYR